MAGDIFFTESRAWSSSSNGFVDMMERAIRKCHANEAPLIKIFSEAEELRSLGINLRKDRGLQAALTQRILEAAADKLQELRSMPGVHPDDIRIVERSTASHRFQRKSAALVAEGEPFLGNLRGHGRSGPREAENQEHS